MHYDILILGGGAAGYFCAANLEIGNGSKRVAILEKGRESLAKVRISGGGRCNVTHACFQNSALVKNYPRGKNFLKKAFGQFSCQETVDWFNTRGVDTKVESDGRMFPVSDSSQSIIDCLKKEVHHVEVIQSTDIVSIFHQSEEVQKRFVLRTKGEDEYSCSQLVVASGSNERVWKMLSKLGHTIIPPVPSLFTFHIDDERLTELQGLSVPAAQVRISGEKITTSGPLLITHWGQSGPAILKLSAFGARILAEKSYLFEVEVNWTGKKQKIIQQELEAMQVELGAKVVQKNGQFQIPGRLWIRLCLAAGIQEHMRYRDLNTKNIIKLAGQLCAARFDVKKKSTFKEEFVTAGGVDTSEVDVSRFESRLIPGMYMAGEVLNIDAVTGGFNFQAAWTGGYIIAQGLNNIMKTKPLEV
jgi:predicted Rossmann fold flavoprotein